ncbi:cytochrome C oxidase subunit IV family protein [Neorhizobium sp. T786]|uniref:cytochrome C oxidase subunit IV family protein n=1 Tax=Pseudorhizobium xiangyangii TaxID=2883104 RepID=UPI001CFF7FB7|nr:cytochrome C oxidase subunit IV family protein [Neorhizobium xiangyangii]MCB5203484.1 cytochrome C oxidase subunit IV family protein [Neorhizobium xiangyangii]
MKAKESSRLFSSANWVMMLAIVGALIAAQWKHEAVPLAVIVIILVLTLIKARLIILDFMGLRGDHPAMAAALWVWPAFFSLATLGRALGSLW